tara:strand:+ start:1846 stop:2250 length:405 start_codon:yes stop_codon:yes gene_type:complete
MNYVRAIRRALWRLCLWHDILVVTWDKPIGLATPDVHKGLVRVGWSYDWVQDELQKLDWKYLIVLPKGRNLATTSLMVHEMVHWWQDRVGFSQNVWLRELMAYAIQWVVLHHRLEPWPGRWLLRGMRHSIAWKL